MPASDHYWRPLGMMHKVFAGSAFALFASTIIMMVFDEDREWRRYQAEAIQLQHEQLRQQSRQFTEPEYLEQIADLERKIEEAQDALREHEEEQARLRSERDVVSGEFELLQRESKDKNADRDVARANYDLGLRDNLPAGEMQQLRLAFNAAQETADDYARQLEVAQTARGDIQAELDALSADREVAQGELDEFRFQQQQLADQMELLQPEHWFAAWKREFKTWPIINGFNPELTLQDKQDWIPDLKQQLGMARVARFDRCRACHVHIDNFAAGGLPAFPPGELDEGGYPQPFSSHPHSELYISDGSPHPKTAFGCTICHDGDGSGTSFQHAEHTPDDPIEAHAWEEEYDWHSNHFWEYPMLPTQFIESTCLKCHHDVIELGVNEQYGATAPQLYDGYNLISEYGCFGCHEINGFDGADQIGPDLRLEPNTLEELAAIEADPNQVAGRMRKVGPSLRHVADKTTPEFIAYWTEMPSRFRPDTRMPQFFDLTNQHDALAAELQPVELAGIAAYLTENSEPLELEQPPAEYEPDAERGSHLFSRKGCLACHSHDAPQFEGIQSDFGPNLSRVHEKIRVGEEGFNWLYTWLRDPMRHHARTRMPNLFLAPEEAADIATFLLQGDRGEFPALDLAPPYLGVVLDDENTAETGVRVLSILQGSSAERATTLPVDASAPVRSPLELNDILLRVGEFAVINETAIESAEQLDEVAAELEVGTVLVLTIMRDGAEQQRLIEVSDEMTDLGPLALNEVLLRIGEFAIEGEAAIENAGQLDDLIAEQPLGTELVLTIWRDGGEQQRLITVSDALTDLTRLYLEKSVSSGELAEILESGIFKRRQRVVVDGVPEWEFVPVDRAAINGDEIELSQQPDDGESLDEAARRNRQLQYVGRRTISRYGCYGCHDIPGFEDARPIGTALQDWGRKDTSKLAPEHIEEWLHHHGEPDGSSTHERIEGIVNLANEESATHDERMAAFFYESLQHHGRPGFLWQKLRQPRSFDYGKVETKGWDERLRMPRFPLNDGEIEAIATFVLGLVADPPPSEYIYQPEGEALARIEGERLLQQYNCSSCHMLEMPGFRYEADLRELVGMSRTELEDWLTARADPLADGTILQPVLTGEALPNDFAVPAGLDEGLAQHLAEQFILEQGSLAARATTVPTPGADPMSDEARANPAPLRSGDVVLRLADTEITGVEQLDDLLSQQAAGTSLVLTIWRGEAEEQRLITVSEGLTSLPRPYLGVVVDDDFTAEEAAERNLVVPEGEAPPGVHILSVYSPDLDDFLDGLEAAFEEEGIEAPSEFAGAQRYVIADAAAYYREVFEAIRNADRRAEAIARERMLIGHIEVFLSNAERFLNDRLLDVSEESMELAPFIGRIAQLDAEDGGDAPLTTWLDRRPELLFADPLPDLDIPETVRLALSLKPPVGHGPLIESAGDSATVEIRGLVAAEPDPTETVPEYREYSFDLWENLDVAGRYKLMGLSPRLVFTETSIEDTLPARGGEFAEWLVPQLVDDEMGGDFNKSWQAAPPPLYREGVKVQTPWLYRFLLNPEQLRYTTVLRMPRFNMSQAEAQSLANYFAAVDGQPFPYQENLRHQPEYLDARSAEYQADFPEESGDYLYTSWEVLNAPLCIKCHALGGRPYQSSDPAKDIRGPNLERVENRLRPEWVELWLHKPLAITSFTSMPSNFPANTNPQIPDLFGGNPEWQTEAVVDALMNYYNLMEQHGVTIYEPPMSELPADDAAGEAAVGEGEQSP